MSQPGNEAPNEATPPTGNETDEASPAPTDRPNEGK